MNLMFRKNFEKSAGGGGGGGTGGGISGGLGGGVERPTGAGAGAAGALGRPGPVRRSREFGCYPLEHEPPSHSYRTHLLFSAHAAGSPPEEFGERFGPPPRRSSGPHMIKWGGGQAQQAAQAQQRRKQSAQQKELADQPLTPTTASRQVSRPAFRGPRDRPGG